jgi:hypothetical protein
MAALRHVALSLADPALPWRMPVATTTAACGERPSSQAPRRAIRDAHAAPLGARGRLSSRSPPGWLSRRRNTPPAG